MTKRETRSDITHKTKGSCNVIYDTIAYDANINYEATRNEVYSVKSRARSIRVLNLSHSSGLYRGEKKYIYVFTMRESRVIRTVEEEGLRSGVKVVNVDVRSDRFARRQPFAGRRFRDRPPYIVLLRPRAMCFFGFVGAINFIRGERRGRRWGEGGSYRAGEKRYRRSARR